MKSFVAMATVAVVCFCTSMSPVTALAQEQEVGSWRGGKVSVAGQSACLFTRPVVNSLALELYWPVGGEPELQIRNINWTLRLGETVPVELGFDAYSYPFEATQTRSSQIAKVVFDAENGDGITDALGWTDILTLVVDGKTYTVPMAGFTDMLAVASNCAATNPSTTAALGGVLADFAQVPVASFTCAIRVEELYGMPNFSGRTATERYTFDVMDDASLRANGVAFGAVDRIPAAPDPVTVVAYDVNAMMGQTKGNVQLPSTFTDEENAALNAGLGMILGNAFGNRQRLLVINVETDAVALLDLEPSGNASNVARPECYRTR